MFLVGAMVAYGASRDFDVRWLVPLAAGNFIYVGASDLVPEVNKPHTLVSSLLHFAAFAGGLGLLFGLHIWMDVAAGHGLRDVAERAEVSVSAR